MRERWQKRPPVVVAVRYIGTPRSQAEIIAFVGTTSAWVDRNGKLNLAGHGVVERDDYVYRENGEIKKLAFNVFRSKFEPLKE